MVKQTEPTASRLRKVKGLDSALQGCMTLNRFGDFPKLGVPFLGVPIIRTIVFWGLYWGPLILGNYHFLPVWMRPYGEIPHESTAH